MSTARYLYSLIIPLAFLSVHTHSLAADGYLSDIRYLWDDNKSTFDNEGRADYHRDTEKLQATFSLQKQRLDARGPYEEQQFMNRYAYGALEIGDTRSYYDDSIGSLHSNLLGINLWYASPVFPMVFGLDYDTVKRENKANDYKKENTEIKITIGGYVGSDTLLAGTISREEEDATSPLDEDTTDGVGFIYKGLYRHVSNLHFGHEVETTFYTRSHNAGFRDDQTFTILNYKFDLFINRYINLGLQIGSLIADDENMFEYDKRSLHFGYYISPRIPVDFEIENLEFDSDSGQEQETFRFNIGYRY